jgi:hypothetical protein
MFSTSFHETFRAARQAASYRGMDVAGGFQARGEARVVNFPGPTYRFRRQHPITHRGRSEVCTINLQIRAVYRVASAGLMMSLRFD